MRSAVHRSEVEEQGFTLVEILIVIVIMAILAGIVVFAVGNLTGGASNNACKTEADTFATAYQAYKTQSTRAEWSTFTDPGPPAITIQGQADILKALSPALLTFPSGPALKYLSNAAGQGGGATASPRWTANYATGVVDQTSC